MSIELISQDFAERFDDLISSTKDTIRIISPFIGPTTANKLAEYLTENNQIDCKIITRFYREDFIRRVSSIDGLNSLFKAGAEILALKKLHTKLYVFDIDSAIIGSANFTTGGFYTNHELSILLDHEEIVADECNIHFDELWNKIKETSEGKVTQDWIDEELKHVGNAGKNLDKHSKHNFITRGASLSFEPEEQDISSNQSPIKNIDIIEESLTKEYINPDSNIFMKFVGKSIDRINSNSMFINDRRSKDKNRIYFNRRPRAVKDNSIMYIVALSYDNKGRPSPMILGKTITYGFNIKNEASNAEKNQDPWKNEYPYYIELKEGRFIDASIRNTIPLDALHRAVGYQTYPGTAVNPSASRREINRVYAQKSHVRITEMAANYIDELLEKQYEKYGYYEI